MTTALDSSLFEFFEFWIWTSHNSLLSIATNQFASFCTDIRSRQCYFRVFQSGEIWNKKAFFPYILIFLLYKTNRFHVAVLLFSNRSQRTSKCGKNISDTLAWASCATFLFLPHFDVICDLLLNRRTATWNLFVKYMYDYDYSKMKSIKIICFIGNISSFCRIKWDKASEFIEVCFTTIWLFPFKKAFRPVLLQDFTCSRVVLWGQKFCLFPCIMLRTLMPYVCGFASTFCLVLQLNEKKW